MQRPRFHWSAFVSHAPSADPSHLAARRRREILREWPVLLAYLSLVVALTVGSGWFSPPDGGAIPVTTAWSCFAWLFIVGLFAAFSVVHHAECLAVKLGEPYGTLVLTLSVIGLEVLMIATVMLTKGENPVMARDTMNGVLMIVLNGLFGLAIIVGAFQHRLQNFNLKSSETFIGGIVVLSGLGLVLPRFVTGESVGIFEVFLIVACLGVYGVFLRIQTVEHRGFFEFVKADGSAEDHHHADSPFGVAYHVGMLIATLVPLVVLAKKLSVVLDVGLLSIGFPDAFAGLVVAILILAPEGLAAIVAARHDNMQRAVNICLGSALATIGLTIPTVLVVAWIAGQQIELGLEPADMVLLISTLLLLTVNLVRGESNIMKGVLHLVLFAAFVVFVFV